MTGFELELLKRVARGNRVLELGAHLGRSTLEIASTAKYVVSVDWHGGDEHNGFGDSLIPYMDNVRAVENVIPIVGRFETVVPLFRDGSFDCIFIDGYHTREAVDRDISLCEQVMAYGTTWWAFHDYGLPDFGVTEAVDDWMNSGGWLFSEATCVDHLFVVKVR